MDVWRFVCAAKRADGSRNGRQTEFDHCPEHFFSLNQSDSNSPCYHISSERNHRKSWQEAASSCQLIGAKLAEPQTSNELSLLSNYLLTRTHQIGAFFFVQLDPFSSSRFLNSILQNKLKMVHSFE